MSAKTQPPQFRDDHRLLDVKEAADLLRMKPATLYQWAYERRIPAVKIFGRSLRFKRSTILKLIADSERPAASRHKRPENEIHQDQTDHES